MPEWQFNENKCWMWKCRCNHVFRVRGSLYLYLFLAPTHTHIHTQVLRRLYLPNHMHFPLHFHAFSARGTLQPSETTSTFMLPQYTTIQCNICYTHHIMETYRLLTCAVTGSIDIVNEKAGDIYPADSDHHKANNRKHKQMHK